MPRNSIPVGMNEVVLKVSGLRKLGSALEKFSPQVSRHLLASADVMDDQARRQYSPRAWG